VTLARGAFAFERVEHQGWDTEAAACVAVAVHPLDHNSGRKAERAVRQAAREFAHEVYDLPEHEALIAALGALVGYIALARRFGDRTYESWWMHVAEIIERKIEVSAPAAGMTDIYSSEERESMAAAGIDPTDTVRVAAYFIEHPNCTPASAAKALRLDEALVRFHMCSGVARGLFCDGGSATKC
jgi:hypothetical protein